MHREAMVGRKGFSLPEVLVCIAILALLAGLLHAAFAPARESAQVVSCLSNLTQISHAIRMYRDDYGGQDPPTALTWSQLGLPAEPRLLMPYLGRNWAIFRCPSEYWGPTGPAPIAKRSPLAPFDRDNPSSYMWQIKPDDYPQSPVLMKFSEKVAKRGEDTPLVIDPHHSGLNYGEPKNLRFIIVRLSGQVHVKVVPRVESTYLW